MAHITGGGLLENIPRVLPENTVAEIKAAAWQMPKLFQWLQEKGNVAQHEMYRTFNCGIGMVVIISAQDKQKTIELLQQQGETVFDLGFIRERHNNEHQTQII